MTALLETEGLTVTFGGLNANDEVDLAVEAGSVSYTHLRAHET